MRFLLASLLVALASGCSPSQNTVEDAVKKNLPRPKYAEFKDFQRYDNNTVCGYYMGVDHMGDMHGFRPFIYTPDFVDVSPNKSDYYIFCSSEQATRLQELRGFAINQNYVSTYIKVRDDFLLLDDAISRHIETNKALPVSLEDLVDSAAPSALSITLDVLTAATVDPWGNNYQYEEAGWGGVSLDYQMCTRGADGEPGGVSINTDICKADLRYFSILLNL